jgi:hypothetical protein
LHQFVKPHLLQRKTLYPVLYHFGDFAHHPARFIIFVKLAKHCIIFIILVFPIFLILRTCKFAHIVSSAKKYSFLVEWLRRSGRAVTEPSETARWQIPLRPVSIQCGALHIAL